jgi:hypothetical protein
MLRIFEFLRAAPSQERADDPAVSGPGVFVTDAGLEEFISGEGGIRRACCRTVIAAAGDFSR